MTPASRPSSCSLTAGRPCPLGFTRALHVRPPRNIKAHQALHLSFCPPWPRPQVPDMSQPGRMTALPHRFLPLVPLPLRSQLRVTDPLYSNPNKYAKIKCSGCVAKELNPPPVALGITPGPLYRLSCDHFQCRTCLTEQHHARGPDMMPNAITCPVCNIVAGFPQNQYWPWSFGALVHSPNLLMQILDMDILNINSPHFAARDYFISGCQEARAVLGATYYLTTSQYGAPNQDISALSISSRPFLVLSTASSPTLMLSGSPIPSIWRPSSRT